MGLVITLSTNAADCRAYNSLFYGTETTLDYGDTGAHGHYLWIPFAGVAVPPNSIINSATLKTWCAAAHSGTTCKILIGCEDADNPADPTTYADVTGRVMTSAYLQNDNVGAQTLGTEYDFTITGAVAEVIARAGWVYNNKVAVMVNNNGSSTDANRTMASYEHATYTEPQLSIDYTPPAGGEPTVVTPFMVLSRLWRGWTRKRSGLLVPEGVTI